MERPALRKIPLHFVATISMLEVLLAVALLPCCASKHSGEGSWSVAVSIPPQAYLVERIGESHVRVATLLQPGESPASYQPSDKQVSEVLRSKIYFRIGVPFENGKWLDAIKAAGQEVRIVDLREGIRLRHFAGGEAQRQVPIQEAHPEGPGVREERRMPQEKDHSSPLCIHEGADPHIWLSPELLMIQSRTVARVLEETDPAHAIQYRENLNRLLERLQKAHTELKQLLLPWGGKRIYVYHPAWGYFCDAYGLEQVPLEIEGKEPSDQELTRLQAKARMDGVKVIFVQPQIAGRSAEALGKTLGAKLRRIDPLARDVPRNLRAVAQAIVESFR